MHPFCFFSSFLPTLPMLPSQHPVAPDLLHSICRSHGLPLALTWAPCLHHSRCISIVHSASFAADDDSRCFLATCSHHHLLRLQGIAGRAFATNKRCFATDVSIFTKSTYPLSHVARMFGLHAALAVPLVSRATSAVEFVLELFFPRDSRDAGTQRQTLNALVTELHQRFWRSAHLVVDKELAEEVIFPVKQPTLVRETSPEESPWISHMVEANRRGKNVSLSWEYQRDDECKATWTKSGEEGESSSAEKKRRSKAEKEISLEVLRQHFAGSLKEAAKSIGVCPTTLKRVCRQHGISRWPSRKIKKVGHSLRKLQVVMESVQGVQPSLHLSSFYSTFPQLTTASDPNITRASPSSSATHTSCSSTGTTFSDTDVNAATPSAPLHRHCKTTPSAPLHRHCKTTPLHPLATAQTTKDLTEIRVEATFRESKASLSLQPLWRLEDLRREIADRFAFDVATDFSLKYLDDDEEWVLLTCDADLEECIDISSRSSQRHTIRLLVHHSLTKSIP